MNAVEVLPPEIRRYVRRFVARQRRLALVKAAGVAVAFALGWILMWCLVDRLVGLGSGVRVGLLLIGAIASLVVVARPLAQAVKGSVNWAEAAAQIESRQHGFGQRLETLTTQLLSGPEYRGSTAILESLASQVRTDVEGAAIGSLLLLRSLVRPWVVAGVFGGGLVAMMQLPWLGMPALVRRFVLPLSPCSAVTTTRLHVIPGNHDVPPGSPVEIVVGADRLDGASVTLHLAGEKGGWSEVVMSALPVEEEVERPRQNDAPVPPPRP